MGAEFSSGCAYRFLSMTSRLWFSNPMAQMFSAQGRSFA